MVEAQACPACGTVHEQGATCPATGGPARAAPPHVSPVPSDPLIGAMVGSFRVQRLLGRGGMGAVYLAEHPVIGSRVAIKFLHESLAQNPELVGRFYDEARAVNLIGHENIVAVYDLALLPPGRYYIVMEHLEGRTLASLVRAGPVAQELALDVLVQLTGALHAAHQRGVIHRDLKPENVFLVRRRDTDHFVKLVDFGIAKLGDRSHASHTAAGMIVGTPEYMAPEQCDTRDVDARADVYALGVMAYEVVTGRLPFTAPGIAQVLLAQLKQAPRPPHELRADLDPAFEQAILKALAKAPADRHADMDAFGDALRAVRARLAGRPAAREAAGEAATVVAPPPRSPPGPAPAPAPAAARAEVELEVRSGGVARRLRVAEASRGGLFFRADGELPALFSRVVVLLPDGSRTLAAPGEVVRHVSAAQAASWNMAPGFAVQLGTLSGDERAAADALAARLDGRAPPADRETVGGTGALRLLESLERRARAGHYELLDLPHDTGFPEARERARGLKRQVEDMRVRLPPEAQVARTEALLERIEQAGLVLGTPAERLVHDARHGNFRGVARCLTAGVPAALRESRRQALLAEQPERRAEAERRLARSNVAAKMGNAAAALAELEAALRADPLGEELHRRHAELAEQALRAAPAGK